MRDKDNKFYCYVLRLPDGTPFYVGFGREARTHNFPCGNADAVDIRRKLREAGQMYIRTKEAFDTADEALAREEELIVKYGRRVDGGLLVNVRIGVRMADDERKAHAARMAAARMARMNKERSRG